MKHVKRISCVALAALIGFVCIVRADTKDDAKARRRARRAQIEQIVDKGEATEGGNGYLEAAANLSADKQALVKAENADRKIGYEAIAKETGMPLADVQKQAAAAIRRMRASKNE
jgi:uncharacterized protein YdbL (DUF1318 family)